MILRAEDNNIHGIITTIGGCSRLHVEENGWTYPPTIDFNQISQKWTSLKVPSLKVPMVQEVVLNWK